MLHSNKLILILLLSTTFLFLKFEATAQGNWAGLTAGVGLLNASTSIGEDRLALPGFSAGIVYDRHSKSNLIYGAELLYEQRGFGTELTVMDAQGNVTGELYTTRFRYNYISLPITIGYKIGKRGYGFGNAGVVPAFLVTAKTVVPWFNIDSEYTGDTTFTVKTASKFDIAGLAEIGIGYEFGRQLTFGASIRFQHSITSLTNDLYFTDGYIRNRQALALIAFTYKLERNNKQ